MVENRSSLYGIIAIIIGASGLGLGAFSVVNFQILEGSEGLQGVPGNDGQDGIDGTDGADGIDGIDGKDAPGGFIVRILDPNHGEPISGNITIRALVYGSENYSVSVLRNGTEIGTSLPLEWNTTKEVDGWWNLTIKATDLATLNQTQDEILLYTYNTQLTYQNFIIERDVSAPSYEWREVDWKDFNLDFKANAFVFFCGWLEINTGSVECHFGFRLDQQNIIQVAYTSFSSGWREVWYSFIFNNIEPGSHRISFYWRPTLGSGVLTVSPTPRYSFFGITITI